MKRNGNLFAGSGLVVADSEESEMVIIVLGLRTNAPHTVEWIELVAHFICWLLKP